GSLTCVSAAAAMDLPLRAVPRSAHIALPANRGSSRSPLVRAAEIHRDRHVVAPSGPLVPAPLALAHASRCLPVPEVVALMDAALARGLVTTEELRRYRPRSGVVPFEHAVRLADGTAQSFPESLARVALRGAGLSVRSQVLLPGVGRVDFLVEDTVIVEIDGRAYHSDPAQFLADRRRDRASLRLGYATLRFAAVEVLASTDELTSQVVEVVRRRAA
ncbi:MAG: DUF559 domain-containing protein, partial [Actinomycetota bacterium]|nr:DUF559 domain-containing protein [Actinomycetota bacterium]